MQLRSQDPESTMWATLEDIVTKIQIEPNFCILHPNYQPWELLPETIERIQLLPTQLQSRCWSLHLRNFLYRTYYSGSIEPNLTGDTNTGDRALHQNLENNTFFGVDVSFYEQLHASNSSTGYFDPGWQVLRQESDGSLAVNKDGLTLHVERDRHLQLEKESVAIGDEVAIRLPKNEVQDGYYVAISNAGRNNSTDSQLVRIYFNLLAEGAVTIMANLTQQLNDIYLPFSFKLLYNPSEYKRYYSGVLYFAKEDYADVHTVVQQIYSQSQSYFQPLVPLFTKLLAPGLALAEAPNNSGKESFGLNRCQMLADGLLNAWNRDDNADNRLNSISQRFSSLGIDLQRPYLNANSEDIYLTCGAILNEIPGCATA